MTNSYDSNFVLPKILKPSNNSIQYKRMIKAFFIIQTLINIELSILILMLYHLLPWNIEIVLLATLPLTYPLTYWQSKIVTQYMRNKKG